MNSLRLASRLRAAGAQGRFVALGPSSDSENPPLILTDLASLRDANWWRQWRADVVLFNSWGAPLAVHCAYVMGLFGEKR